MFYIKDKDNKYVISKNAIAELPKRDEVTEMLKLEESQMNLRSIVIDATSKMKGTKLTYNRDLSNVFVPIVPSILLMLGTDFSIGFKLATGTPFTATAAGVLLITNLACGSILYTFGKEKIRLDKEYKKAKIQFNKIRSTVEKEIQRQFDEERNIAGDDLELKTAYIKIRTL